jgi:hypothetical protein
VGDDSDVLERLYAVDPEEFVSERKRLERSLRDDGRTEEAAKLAKLRKPPLPVFAANRLAREEPDDVAQLIAAGERLSAAHGAGDPDALRKEQAELAARVRALVRQAESAVGKPLSEPMEQRLAVLLRAAASDPDTAALLRRGVLAEEVVPAAFDALAGISLTPSAPRPEPERNTERAGALKQKKRVKELEDELAEARDALRHAARELRKAQAEVERAEGRVARANERLEDARRAV